MKQFTKHPNIKRITVYADGEGSHAIQVNDSTDVFHFADDDYGKSIRVIVQRVWLFQESLSRYKRKTPGSVKVLTINFK